MSISESLGLSELSINNNFPDYSQDYIPIKNIVENGVIVTKDGRYLKILEVGPINFNTLSFYDKDAVIADFAAWLTISPVNIQLYIPTEITNSDKIVDALHEQYEKNKDHVIKPYVDDYSEFLRNLGDMGAQKRNFYLIISYEPDKRRKLTELQDITNELEFVASEIKHSFMMMGNYVTDFGESDNIDRDDNQKIWDLSEFFYKLYNPRTSKDELNKPKITFLDRVRRAYQDKKTIMKNDSMKPGFDDLVAPTGIDTTRPDCIILDGKYYCYLLIEGDSYPMSGYAGWFNNMINLEPGEAVNVFLRKESASKAASRISNKFKFSQAKIEESSSTDMGFEQLEKAVEAARYIKNQLSMDGIDLFHLTTMITLSADRYEDLIQRKDELIMKFKSQRINLNELKYLQEEAFQSSFPLLSLHPKLYKKGERNITTDDIASIYPFDSPDMVDDGGVLLGVDTHNYSMCVFNPFNDKIYNNGNITIMGTSGSGKTYTLSLIALRLRAMGTQCFILAPEKAHEYARSCKGVNGEFIKISQSSTQYINIMEIRPIVRKTMSILSGEDIAENVIYLTEKTSVIKTFISLLNQNLTIDEMNFVDSCIIETYRKFGITEDNNSIYIDNNKSKGLKAMPTLSDLYDELVRQNAPSGIISVLKPFVSGSYKSFNNQTNVNLNNKFIVFDISSLDENILPAGMFVVLDFIMGRVKEDITEKKMVFIDEGWKLIGGGSNQKAAQYVQTLFKTIRGYRGAACIATQNIKDFFSLDNGKYGDAILSNSQTKMILRIPVTEIDSVQNILKLNDVEARLVSKGNGPKGECLMYTGAIHVPIQIMASHWEHQLITTGSDVENIVKGKEKGEF